MKPMMMLLLVLVGFAPQAQAESPKAYGLFYYADWCTACKMLEPKLTALAPELADQPIEIIRIDLTDRKRALQSLQQAQELGVGEVASRFARATGFMVIVGAEDQQVIDRVFANQTQDQIRQKLRQAINI